MPLVVDADPFSLTCNSYIDVAFMDDYVTTRVYDPAVKVAWDALTNDLQATYLVNATRLIDGACEWIGDKYSREQLLKWPRSHAIVDGYLLDVTLIPEKLKEAIAEMVIFTLGNDGLISVREQESLQSVKVGPINVRFNNDTGQPANRYFPDIIAYLLRDLGEISNPNLPGSNSARNVRLQRA